MNYQHDEDEQLHHVLLPRVLPSEKGNLYKTEFILMNQMVNNVESLTDFLPSQTVKLFQSIRRIHTERSPTLISNEIRALKPGDTFAMFVRFQHNTIMIHVPPNENAENIQNAIVATIPGALHPNEIYKHESDMEFNYPQQAIDVRFSEMLKSDNFCNQLCVLFDGLPIERQNRDCVSKWLIALLMNENSTAASEFPIITKKIRDEMLGDSNTNYFRRSSFYMSLKVLLQHNLTMHHNEEEGKILYKIAMLKFLTDTIAPYTNYNSFDIHLLSQMIAKLARRIEKLILPDKSPAKLIKLHKMVIDETKETIKKIRNQIDKQICKIQQTDEDKAELPLLKGLNFKTDICHKLRKLENYLEERQKCEIIPENNEKKPIVTYDRYFKNGFPEVHTINDEHSALSRRIFWLDFEKMVLYEMTMECQRLTVNELREWSFKYAEYAENQYTNNPLFISRMLLVRLKLIAMLDKRATHKYPLLKEHHSAINIELIESLLIPQSKDMQIAYELEQYFKERNANDKDPSLIGETSITIKSFSVKYAARNSEMRNLRDEILAKDQFYLNQKHTEWTEGRRRVEALKNDANRLYCEFFDGGNGWMCHSCACVRCKLQAEARQVNVKQYEHLLPEAEYEQLAVVFELRIPNEIACLRDVLYSFNAFCFDNTEILEIKGDWKQRLIEFNKSTSVYVTLGSQTRGNMNAYPVDCPFEKLHIECTYDCVLHSKHKSLFNPPQNDCVKTLCTFQTSGEYIGLQWTLKSTKHTENQVLSSQSKCQQELNLSEYKNYGTLRSDSHRLQLRKLYAMIKTEALAFEQESVLVLIMQMLWECEKSNEHGYIREAHIDLSDKTFCSATIELLNEFLDRQRQNWAHPFKLIMVTLITVRAFEINHQLAEEIAQLLQKIREIALEWVEQIETSIRDMLNPNDKDEKDLRLKLIYVAIAGGLTYFVHPKHSNYATFKMLPKSLQSWLQFIIILNNNIRMYTNDEERLPLMLRNFLRLMESVGVDMESAVTSLVQKNRKEMFALIYKQWPRAESTTFESIYFVTEHPHILIAKCEQTVSIDIICGTFLVDSLPLSRLPHDIMQSEVYRWFFDNAVFEVQPDSQGNFSTRHKYYNDCNYEFKRINNQIIIIERKKIRKTTKFENELINRQIFEGDFPHDIVNNYSHWWNKTKNCIEFRQRTFGKKHFSIKPTIDYYLDLTNRHLIEDKTKHKMLYINSRSYKRIVNQLDRLEHSKYIHVLLKSDQTEDNEVASVELKRMNLKFEIKCKKGCDQSYDLISNEFGGMRVCRKQKIGTLYGLNEGLVLEGNSKILLIPNGSIGMECIGMHASVSIDIEHELSHPPFYQYQVDKVCRQLKANNGTDAAWFYLAYLHAITSHGEIEPLTGMSGTERAIQILQSAYVWSSSPYDTESVQILNAICRLTPIRRLTNIRDEFPKQIVTWPVGIPQHSAQDCFVFIATELIDDSQRLQRLYPESSKQMIKFKTDFRLNERDHWRFHQLSPNLRVSKRFMQHKLLNTSLPDIGPIHFAENMRNVCNLYHKQRFYVPTNLNLTKFLTKGDTLDGTANNKRISKLLIHNVRKEFRDLWIPLYDAARGKSSTQLTSEQFAIILSFFAHVGENIEAIYALQAIQMNPNEFERIDPPNVETFTIETFNKQQVRHLLDSFVEFPNEYNSYDWTVNGLKLKFDVERLSAIDGITKDIDRDWKRMPFSSYDFATKWSNEFKYINYENANAEMNNQLEKWHEHHRLSEFIDCVEARLKLLVRSSSPNKNRYSPHEQPLAKTWTKYQINLDAKMDANLDGNVLYESIQNEAQNVWERTTSKLTRSADDWFKIYNKISDTDATHHLIQAGLFDRMIPSLLLPKILNANTDNRLKHLIGAWAVTIAHEQRKNRIQIYSERSKYKAALDREMADEPHVNWKPCEYPEWLLFEIEQNLTIRKIQIEIAKRMINPPEIGNAKHSVMQLNMGEGKTAVIVPILAAKLANQDHACQITVLKSLFNTNLKSLRQYLGGFLNRHIYIFPCRRDLPIVKRDLPIEIKQILAIENIKQILAIYKECKRNKGVILTLPEYRLSFQLKIYESIENGQFKSTQKLLQVHKWTNANIRNILDESDAILHTKYQLIYTIGNQMAPDGGLQRWSVAQAVLKRVPFHMNALYKKHGKDKIEFNKQINNRSDVFKPCRILDDIDLIFEELKKLLVNDFINGLLDMHFTGINADKKEKLERLLSEKILDQKAFQVIDEFPTEEANKLWILNGLLRCEVLKSALTKRWRVNYGVSPNGRRKMAIPFKAKDVAAEMTEFGHPDLAVCLTQLSYYYEGLTDAQMKRVFKDLDNMQDKSAIYGKWISSIPNELIEPSFKSYDGVNLEDPNQCEKLFRVLYKNMHVIDFYVLKVVSNELKTFEKKLMCTAWDLCSHQLEHKVTGFSGTNDTKNLLPMSIVQNDLKELEDTNERMRQTLLHPRNQRYKSLPPNVSGKKIIDELNSHGIPVLLDSGALMLELNNKQVAFEWIKLATNYDAAIYFDESDTLQTIDRNGIVTKFDYSVYREDLSKCVVYLDDAHTRGTDLKFPLDWKACVTLSGDITRDKTVQSCMRMRQLQTSQSISFWASHEADVRIRKVCKLSAQDGIDNDHVIKFIEYNSQQFEKNNMIHWTMASINYTKKLIGHMCYENATDVDSMHNLYKKCVDNDSMKLCELYGEKREVLLRNVAWARFSTLARDCNDHREIVRNMQDFVDKKLNQNALNGNETKFTQAFDEEQEKELEQEFEVHTQVERPPHAKSAIPKFDIRLQSLITNGITVELFRALKSDGTLLSMPSSLSHTNLHEFCKNNENGWANHLLITKDFQTVTQDSSSNCDEFLRSVRWIVRIQNPSKSHEYILIILSTFECDHLLAALKTSKNATLFMYRPRLNRNHSNLIHETKLQISGITTPSHIDIHDEIQIGVYSGMMYFDNAIEQNEYCGFLGLIPQPRTGELNEAFEQNIIESDGFVQKKWRHHSKAIEKCVGKCQFNFKPIVLAIELIKAHHQFLPDASHVASILSKGVKVNFDENSMDIE